MTGKEDAKAESERAMVTELVHKLNGDVAVCESIQSLRPPEPDVLYIRRDGARIGIEVTQIVPGGNEQRRAEGEQSKLLAEASRLALTAGLSDLDVAVFLTDGFAFSKENRSAIATELVSFVRDRIPAQGTTARFDLCDWPQPPLPRGVDTVRVWHDRMCGFNWHAPQAGHPLTLTREMVVERIAAKAKRRTEYREEYDAVWLLVCSGVDGPSTWAMPPEPSDFQGIVCPFDELYLQTSVLGSLTRISANRGPIAI